MYTCRLKNQFGSDIPIPPGLAVTVDWYSWHIAGGPAQADLTVTGDLDLLWRILEWIPWRITIYNRFLSKVWWGYVEDALVFDGYQMHGLSLKDCYNRIRLAYVYELFGAGTTGVTAWGEDAVSIAGLNLTKEREQTQEIAATPDLAIAERDIILSRISLPLPVSGAAGGSGRPYGTLRCNGFMESLDWRLYQQLTGLEENSDGDGSQVMGQGLSSNLIGFTPAGKIHDLGGRFGSHWVTGSAIKITGSVDNNVEGVIMGTDSRPLINQSASGFVFEPSDDLIDLSDGQLGFLENGDIIRITGTSSNNGTFHVADADAEHCTLRPKTLVNETDPPGGNILRGNWIQIDSGVPNETNEEMPSGTVTIITHGTLMAQSVMLPVTATGWTVAKIEIPMSRVGNPTDEVNLRWRLDAGDVPGDIISTSTVRGDQVGENSGIETFLFAGNLFQPGVKFWLELSRTGANDPENYYLVEVDEGLSYTNGKLLLWTGTYWANRSPDADLKFRILGAWETTEQIRQMVLTTGQLVTGVDIQNRSNRYSNQYRTGDTTALEEILALLEVGTADKRLLIATVTPDQLLKITAQGDRTNARYQYRDGQFLDSSGRELEEGVLPVGEWVVLAGVPRTASAYHRLSPKFLAEARLDCKSGAIEVRWQDESSPWENG